MGAGSSLANRRPVHRRHKPSGQTGTASAPLFGRSVLTVFQSTMSVRFSRTIRRLHTPGP